jgi:hypothetical protein
MGWLRVVLRFQQVGKANGTLLLLLHAPYCQAEADSSGLHRII